MGGVVLLSGGGRGGGGLFSAGCVGLAVVWGIWWWGSGGGWGVGLYGWGCMNCMFSGCGLGFSFFWFLFSVCGVECASTTCFGVLFYVGGGDVGVWVVGMGGLGTVG